MTVTAPRIACEDGWTCSDSRPQYHRVDCYRDLTADPDAPISGAYGEARDKGPHGGLDLAVPTGTPVYAAKEGVVSRVVDEFPVKDRSTPNGNFVRIDYDDGTEGAYLHLESASVEEGDSVDAGDLVGASNDAGYSHGSHLHYTQCKDDTRRETVDPVLEHPDC